MSTRDDERVATRRQQTGGRTMAVISPPPPPEEVFTDWLMSVPAGVSLEIAAQRQVALIDRRGSLHPDVVVLRSLLAAVACSDDWPKPVPNL
ncbi:hypothetical protein CYK37_14580 [Mesorhizobium loti]|nr:hypothetical protein [Mesorhizobium loti]PLP58874.1 hypothetical protein CYK37_14580 [Mesorhizobium loti]